MKIYLVRHGQCDSNVKEIYNYKDEDLNKVGVEQAKFLAEKIKNYNLILFILRPY